jgi:hypothetical protein
MKIYQEVHLDLRNTHEHDLIGLAVAFCEASSAWEWVEDKTDRPDRTNEGPVFSVLYKNYDQSVSPLVHIAKSEQGVFRVTNVTPREISPIKISKDDYNMIAKRFGLDFRAFSKQRSLEISVYIPKADLDLKQIIKSKPARIALERYLSYPFSGHDRDEDPLHEFTCSVFRRNIQLSLEYLERYLVEDRNLNFTDAKECRKKVEIGLGVLRVCKRF